MLFGPNLQFGARQRQQYSYLNCLVLAGSSPHNGSIQAFCTRWLVKKEKLSLYSPPLSPLRSYLLVFLTEWSCRIAELCLNPVPSYLAPAQPARSLRRKGRRGSSPSPRPQRELMYHRRNHHSTVEWARLQLLFVCTIYVSIRSAANGSIMQSLIPAIRRSRPLG